ncbi:MAG: hypothetical protein H8E44_09695 [Planctomycetes bacterium]|nr:hypothetical protein [Planctomycetota bacterium]MBL7042469.1 hypothetical protein [Pirellulaceae bacterium]
MSTGIGNRWTEVVQSLFAIAVLMALFWFCRPGLFADGNSNDGVMGLFDPAAAGDGQADPDSWDHDESDEVERERPYSEILGMPVCTDLEDSIEKVQDARNSLLQAVVDQEAQAELDATEEYREVVQEMQSGFAKLKMRLAPDEFSDVAQELPSLFRLDERPLMPCELGRFAKDIFP